MAVDREINNVDHKCPQVVSAAFTDKTTANHLFAYLYLSVYLLNPKILHTLTLKKCRSLLELNTARW